MRKRIILAIAIVAVVGLLLYFGHAVINGDYAGAAGQAASDVALNNRLQDAAAKTRRIRGVTSVSASLSPLALPEATISISVRTGHSITSAGLVYVAESFRPIINAYASTDTGRLVIDTSNGSRVTETAFGMSSTVLSTEITAWSTLRTSGIPLRESIGHPRTGAPLSVQLTAPGASAATLQRLVASYPTALSRSHTATPGMTWVLPGVQSSDGLPSQAALEVLGRVVATGGLAGASGKGETPGVWLVASPTYAILGFLGATAGDSASTTASLTKSDALLRVVLDGTVGIQDFEYEQVRPGKLLVGYTVHLGACTGTVRTSSTDGEYLSHLRAVGITLPTGSGPGACIPG